MSRQIGPLQSLECYLGTFQALFQLPEALQLGKAVAAISSGDLPADGLGFDARAFDQVESARAI